MSEERVTSLQRLTIDANDPVVQGAADKLVKDLMRMVGEELAIGVLAVAITDILSGVLHMETPEPETNIKGVMTLLNNIRDNVLAHTDCALALNGKTVNKLVH